MGLGDTDRPRRSNGDDERSRDGTRGDMARVASDAARWGEDSRSCVRGCTFPKADEGGTDEATDGARAICAHVPLCTGFDGMPGLALPVILLPGGGGVVTPCHPIRRFGEAVAGLARGSGEDDEPPQGSKGGDGSEKEVMERNAAVAACEDLVEEEEEEEEEEDARSVVVGCALGLSGSPNGVVEADRSFFRSSLDAGVCHCCCCFLTVFTF